jgi:putative membrane protein
MQSAFINFFKGAVIGVTNVVPGMSGGTMAVILGIFDQLIEAAGGFYKDFRRHGSFLIPVGIGAVTGIIAFSSVIEYALLNHSFPTCMFFVGLIVGTIPLIYRKATERSHKKSYMLATLVATLAVIIMVMMRSPDGSDPNAAVDTALMLKMFLGGALAAMVLMIPGVSGSFVLILLGLYPTIISYVSSIKDFLLAPTNFALFWEICLVLGPLSVGIIIGIVLISKVIGLVMKKAYSLAYFAILGLVFGSVFGLFNDPITYQSGVSELDVFIGTATLVLGAGLALKLGRRDV